MPMELQQVFVLQWSGNRKISGEDKVTTDYLPMLRYDLQPVEVEYRGERMFALQDSARLIEGTVLLPREMMPLLVLFDGAHTYRDLQQAMMSRDGNRLVQREEIEAFVAELDRMLLLQTPHLQAFLERLRQTFSEQKERAPALAGSAYPEQPDALESMIDDILLAGEKNGGTKAKGPRALIAPHIDLRLGADIYAAAYNAIRNCQPQRIFLLGTGHVLDDGLFSFTEKSYVTPLGECRTDIAAVRALRDAADVAASPDDFAHRGEHSLEFQVLFLQRLFGNGLDLVPVLVGSFAQFLPEVADTRQLDEVHSFCTCLHELADETTLVIAGVDFCHVGPKFGHPEPATAYEDEFRGHDERLLDAVCRGSLADFWTESRRVGDEYNVCGLGALTCLLQAFPELRGERLAYDVWHEQATQSAVSFAAVRLA